MLALVPFPPRLLEQDGRVVAHVRGVARKRHYYCCWCPRCNTIPRPVRPRVPDVPTNGRLATYHAMVSSWNLLRLVRASPWWATLPSGCHVCRERALAGKAIRPLACLVYILRGNGRLSLWRHRVRCSRINCRRSGLASLARVFVDRKTGRCVIHSSRYLALGQLTPLRTVRFGSCVHHN
jgi:hypothetical protein